jgi:IS4 transposase
VGGRLNEINMLDLLPIEAGSFCVTERGYLDFRRLVAMHQAGAFFVTGARSAMDAMRVYPGVADRNRGVICDQRVMFKGRSTSKNILSVRRIRFGIPIPARPLVFLTNNTALPALTIAALYKSRLQVELFFKWINSTRGSSDSWPPARTQARPKSGAPLPPM